MGQTPQHLKTLEEVERECIPGLVEVLREEGLEAVRYFLWDMTGWHHNYDPVLWRNRATEEQKRVGWEMWVRMDRITCAVLREAHERQVEEIRRTPSRTDRSASTGAAWMSERERTAARKRTEYPRQSELPPRDAPEASGEPGRVA